MTDLDADVNSVVWVTSAYLLAYAVPVLITGRLGDRFGPKRIYLIGLVVFTLASLWCGLTGSVEMLIVARVVPGPRRRTDDAADDGGHHPDLPVGPPRPGDGPVGRHRRRGHAGRADPRRRARRHPGLGVDLLHQRAGRRRRLRPRLAPGARRSRRTPTGSTGSGWRSAASACSLLVFGIQEGHQYDWGQITGIVSVWGLIILGLVFLGALRLVAGGQPQRAAGAPEPLQGPQLLDLQLRDLDDVLHGHVDGLPADALRPAGARAVADRGGTADGADGGGVDRDGADRRPLHRPGAPAGADRLRLRVHRGGDPVAVAR